ncbi:MAG: response regulator transcription factor [Pseudomonadota bacterium]
MNKTKIIIVDDHAILRAGVKKLVEQEASFEVVGEAGSANELYAILENTSCDLIILDLSLPEISGLEIISRLKKSHPKIKILVLTMHKDSMHFKHSIAKGAAGFILKDDAFEQLLFAIKTIQKGKKFISPSVSNIFMDNYIKTIDEAENTNIEILTNREKEVLKNIAKGLANKDIAKTLNISVRTVEFHRLNLSKKLGIKTSAGLVKYAISKGII